MTFKHRLARRLAQSRTIGGAVAAAVIIACNGGNDTAGPTSDSVTSVTPPAGSITSLLNSSKCMDVVGQNKAAGTAVVTYACNGGPNQIFTYNSATQEIKAYGGTMCLDDSTAAGRDGDAIIIWQCLGDPNQKWQFTSAKEIKGINGKCIDIKGGKADDKAHLILNTCSGATSQKWDASRVISGTTSPSGPGEQARGADAFVNTIGVATHLNYTDKPQWQNYSGIIKPRLLELGVRHIRDGMNVWPQTRSRYQDLAANGIRLTGVCEPVGWYQGSPNWSKADCTTYANQIGTATVETFEGMNEVDNTGGSNWVNNWKSFEQALWTLVKNDGTWRSTPVASNSLAHYYNAKYVGNQSAILDYGTMHPYPGGGPPSQGLKDLNIASYQLIVGSKPLIATETGWHNSLNNTSGQPGVSERASGKYYSRLFFEYFNAGVLRTYAYDLINDGTTGSNAEHNFGLLRYDGSPKPQFTAIKNVIAILKDPGGTFAAGQLAYTLSGSLTNVHRTLLQKRDGRFYLVLWQEVSSFNLSSKTDINVAPAAVTLQLGKAASSIKVYRPVSSTTPVAQYSGTQSVSLSVPDEALIVEIAF